MTYFLKLYLYKSSYFISTFILEPQHYLTAVVHFRYSPCTVSKVLFFSFFWLLVWVLDRYYIWILPENHWASLVAKLINESACNAGDPCSIPGSERSPGEGIGYPSTAVSLGFSGGSACKESSCKVGDLGLISGLGRSPGEGTSYPLQYSGLENSVDRIVHGLQRLRHESLAGFLSSG